MESNQKKKWFDNKIIVHLLLLFIYPLGLYPLWKTTTIARWWKITASILFFIVFISIISDTESTDKDKKPVKELSISEKKAHLDTAASRLNGASFITNVNLIENRAEITYATTLSEHLKAHPESGINQLAMDNYWNTGNAINKALASGALKLLIKLDYIDEVKITIPNKGPISSVLVTKNKIEKFEDDDYNVIINAWKAEFPDIYVYNKKGNSLFIMYFKD